MAYLNDDVRSPIPDIEKIQLDIKRLKDFIAYKVHHSDQERDQYRPQGPGSQGGQTPRGQTPRGQTPTSKNRPNSYSDSATNIDDSKSSYKHDIDNERDSIARQYEENSKELTVTPTVSQMQLMALKTEIAQVRAEAEDSRSKLEKNEAEAASFIGKIGIVSCSIYRRRISAVECKYIFNFAGLFIFSFNFIYLLFRDSC